MLADRFYKHPLLILVAPFHTVTGNISQFTSIRLQSSKLAWDWVPHQLPEPPRGPPAGEAFPIPIPSRHVRLSSRSRLRHHPRPEKNRHSLQSFVSLRGP